jgi:hypothetical protein
MYVSIPHIVAIEQPLSAIELGALDSYSSLVQAFQV